MSSEVYNQVRAAMGGYFWLPCPLCGKEFGGHQWRDYDGKKSTVRCRKSRSTAHGICPDCTKAGKGEPFSWDLVNEPPEESCPYC
jgi:hypothetical protein